MPRYHFRIVDGHIVSAYGTLELADEGSAEIEALRLSSLVDSRPEIKGKNRLLVVTDAAGEMVCSIPIK
jgi:hypothetical protein